MRKTHAETGCVNSALNSRGPGKVRYDSYNLEKFIIWDQEYSNSLVYY